MALEDFTFKDGTFIPKGTMVSVAQRATHTEAGYYDDPLTFDPWRFSRIREEEGNITKQMATTASVDYIPFGLGRHAWCVPARLTVCLHASNGLAIHL